jgi:anaerobic selenocysteine-containing dehydrogenase
LQEISHTNPLWVHPEDATRIGLENGALARVATQIGYFVLRTWITEGIHPGVVACSHHVGRWRLHREVGGHCQASAMVEIERGPGTFRFRQKLGPTGLPPSDPDHARAWWREIGVNQNLTFAVQPDPVSGMHCWHQKVVVTPAQADDQYADVFVDTNKSRAVYAEWLTKARPPTGDLRRPLWLNRPLHPTADAYRIPPGARP